MGAEKKKTDIGGMCMITTGTCFFFLFFFSSLKLQPPVRRFFSFVLASGFFFGKVHL